MKKSMKVVATKFLAGSLLLGGMLVGSGNVEAASIADMNGSAEHVSNASQLIDNIIQTGKNLQGRAYYSHHYVAGESMDCSGFTYYIFGANGVDLKTKDDDRQVHLGSYVPKNQLQKGDLVFFSTSRDKSDITHVGVYIGDGKLLHMANSRSNVTISDLNSSWYTENYVTAKRVIN